MKKYAVILAFLVCAAGIGALYSWFGPMSREEAIARAFVSVREAHVFSGVALVASTAPASGPSAEQDRSAMRAAFQLALPNATTAGSGQAIFTLIDAAAVGADAYAEVRSLPDGKSFFRIDNLPPGSTGSLFGRLDKAWWETDLATLGGMISGDGGVTADGSGLSPAELSADEVALRWLLVRDMLLSERLYAMGRPTVEFLGGRLMHRVELGFHREVAGQLLRAGREALLEREITAEEITLIDAQLQKASALLTIWVDAGNGRLEKMLLEFGTPTGVRQTVLVSAIDLETSVVVEAPTGARSLESILETAVTETEVANENE